jgi:hypothetical protein
MSDEEQKPNTKTSPMIYVAGVVMLLVACAGSFYGGMRYQQSRTPEASAQFPGLNGQRPGGRNGSTTAGTIANGEVISKDDQSITIKLQDGGSKIVYFSGSTTIGKTTTGTAADLKTGEQVMANGSSNSDGSVGAQNIQIRPDNGGNPPGDIPPVAPAGT